MEARARASSAADVDENNGEPSQKRARSENETAATANTTTTGDAQPGQQQQDTQPATSSGPSAAARLYTCGKSLSVSGRVTDSRFVYYPRQDHVNPTAQLCR